MPPNPPIAERIAQGTALALTAAAMVASYAHALATVEDAGQTGPIAWLVAAMPETTVLLALLRLRLGGRGPWAWLALTLGLSGTVVGNLAQATPGALGTAVALSPALFSVACLGMVHLGGSAAPVPGESSSAVEPGPVSPSEPATAGQLVQRRPVRSPDDTPTPLGTGGGSEPVTGEMAHSVPPPVPAPEPDTRADRLAWVRAQGPVTLAELERRAVRDGVTVSRSTLARDRRDVTRELVSA